jgi:hypothetical protein
MKKLLSLLALGLALSFGTAAQAQDFAGTCAAQSAEKKLAGAAKTSFEKKCVADAQANANAMCEKSAADKKLAGAAKNSHVKKCMADQQAAPAKK